MSWDLLQNQSCFLMALHLQLSSDIVVSWSSFYFSVQFLFHSFLKSAVSAGSVAAIIARSSLIPWLNFSRNWSLSLSNDLIDVVIKVSSPNHSLVCSSDLALQVQCLKLFWANICGMFDVCRNFCQLFFSKLCLSACKPPLMWCWGLQINI